MKIRIFLNHLKDKDTITPLFNDKLITNNRQNLKKIYSPNGAIYIFYANDFIKRKKLTFKKSGYYLMNKIDSIDIDNKEDYELAKFLSKKYLKIKMKFKIAHREIGLDKDPLIIAEIGINHNGNLNQAIDIADSAIKSGAEILKHQTHIPDEEMSLEAIKVIPGNSKQSIYKIIKHCYLS